MYNEKNEFDKGFQKGLEIGQKIGFFESKIQAISINLSSISESLSNESIKGSLLIDLDDCIAKLDDALEQITDL